MAEGQMSVLPGVADLIGAAVDRRNDSGFEVPLSFGDLGQMAAQKRFLLSRGFVVGQRDVYPALRQADADRAFKLLWENRVEGWWCMQDAFVSRGICTKEEFRAAFAK